MLDRMKQYLQSLQQITADVDFDELSDALRLSMDDSSVYVLGRKGKLIGYALEDGFDSTPSTPTGCIRVLRPAISKVSPIV